MSDVEEFIKKQQNVMRKQAAAIGALTHVLIKSNLITGQEFIDLESWFEDRMIELSILISQIPALMQTNSPGIEDFKKKIIELTERIENKALCQN